MSDVEDSSPDSGAYQPPAPKSVEEILEADRDDPALEKYKQSLLGSAAKVSAVVDPGDSRIVLVQSLSLIVGGEVKAVMDLRRGAPDESQVFHVKEDVAYQLRVDFYVQREIVTGLKYQHKVTKHGIPVDKDVLMIGSYAPRVELQSYTTPVEVAPSGMMHRGKYKVRSKITDDDGSVWMEWTWTLEIVKDW